MIAKRLLVRGRVQGVGFRYALVREAMALGVAGWVRNRIDGSVEALVQGSDAVVAQAVAWCRRGPPAARVVGVDVVDEPVVETLTGFEQRPTA